MHQYGLVITADHGNAEQMYDHVQGQPHTAHTVSPVPCVHVGRSVDVKRTFGTLADVAPSLLHLMGLPIPKVMTGLPLWD